MDTDKTWKRFGEIDPYYGVLASPEYQSHILTDGARENFFRTGEHHVEQMLSTLQEMNPSFSPSRALDFGCGVGRVALPLARRCDTVLGVDVSPGMLSEARKNASERGVENVTFGHAPDGSFDLIHSFMVIQHIHPRRGKAIVRDLASRLDSGGMMVLQFPYRRHAPIWLRAVTTAKRKAPVLNAAVNSIQRLPARYPAMTMFCYDPSDILGILGEVGIDDVRVTLRGPVAGYESLMLYGYRRQS